MSRGMETEQIGNHNPSLVLRNPLRPYDPDRPDASPIRKVLIIDDDPAAFQLQPENAIHISPFENPKDKNDTILLDLIPVLSALITEGVSDFPGTLGSFSSREAVDIAKEYNEKLDSVRGRNRGLAVGRGDDLSRVRDDSESRRPVRRSNSGRIIFRTKAWGASCGRAR